MPFFSRVSPPGAVQPGPQAGLTRRHWGRWAGAASLACLAPALTGCDRLPGWGSTVSKPLFTGIDLTGAPYGRGFALTDMHGTRRTLGDFKGQVVMLYFGFVQCPDVCPTALTRAGEVMRLLGPDKAHKLQVIFVTVDPERDTPELLRHYMAAFDPRFLALHGDAVQTQKAADDFKVFYKKVPTGSTYTMDHTTFSYLFDPQGHLRVALRHEQPAADHAADIATLLAGT